MIDRGGLAPRACRRIATTSARPLPRDRLWRPRASRRRRGRHDPPGPTDPGRELAKVLVQWYVDGDDVDEDAVTATVVAYGTAGGPGRVESLDDFTMVLCSDANFLAGQIRSALDPGLAPEHRAPVLAEIEQGLATYVPTPDALARVLAATRAATPASRGPGATA